MDTLSLHPIFTQEEVESLVDYNSKSLDELIEKGKIKILSPGLYGFVKESRFGLLPPSTNEQLLFIRRKFPHTFIGGASAYNSLGFSTQVPSRLCLFTNHNIPYEFKHFVIDSYPYPISPEWLMVYPLIDYVIKPYVFTQIDKPEELLKKVISKRNFKP